MAFDADCRSFYHTDSFAYGIHVFDYDIEAGDIQNQKLFARFTETDGMPDGLTANWLAHCFAYATRRKECLNSVQMFVCLIDSREEL